MDGSVIDSCSGFGVFLCAVLVRGHAHVLLQRISFMRVLEGVIHALCRRRLRSECAIDKRLASTSVWSALLCEVLSRDAVTMSPRVSQTIVYKM